MTTLSLTQRPCWSGILPQNFVCLPDTVKQQLTRPVPWFGGAVSATCVPYSCQLWHNYTQSSYCQTSKITFFNGKVSTLFFSTKNNGKKRQDFVIGFLASLFCVFRGRFQTAPSPWVHELPKVFCRIESMLGNNVVLNTSSIRCFKIPSHLMFHIHKDNLPVVWTSWRRPAATCRLQQTSPRLSGEFISCRGSTPTLIAHKS